MSLTSELSKTFGAVAKCSHAFPLSAAQMAVHVGACVCVCVCICMWVCCECHCASPLSCLSFNCLHLRRIWRLLFASSSTVCRSVCTLFLFFSSFQSPLPHSFVRLRLCAPCRLWLLWKVVKRALKRKLQLQSVARRGESDVLAGNRFQLSDYIR